MALALPKIGFNMFQLSSLPRIIVPLDLTILFIIFLGVGIKNPQHFFFCENYLNCGTLW